MESFNKIIRELSNLEDDYINSIANDYFEFKNLDDVLKINLKDSEHISDYKEPILKIYHHLKKFEPISCTYIEKNIFDGICQELSANAVVKDNKYDYFDESILMYNIKKINFKIFNLYQVLTNYKVRKFGWSSYYEPENEEYEKFGAGSVKILFSDDDEMLETEVKAKVREIILNLRDKLEKQLKAVASVGVSFEDWKILHGRYKDFYTDATPEEAFKKHLKSLELI